MIIGICGNAGVGKSTALFFLKERFGFECIEIDKIVEDVIKNHLNEINTLINETYNIGPLKREEIYDSYFGNGIESSLIDFEYRTYIDRLLFKELIKYKSKEKIVVVDWFMLELSKIFEVCDYRIYLDADYKLRKERVISRGNYASYRFPLIENVSNPENLGRYHLRLDTSQADWLEELKSRIEFNILGKSKVSIVVPVYNQEQRLARCISSIQNSSYKNIEIIIVDDGSTDGSHFVIENYARNDKRIKVFKQSNQGVGNARNRGMKEATGDYIGFVDSDDYIGLNMIEILLKNAIDSSSDISRCRANMCERGSEYIPNKRNALNAKLEVLDSRKKIVHGYINREVSIAVWDKLFSRKLYTKLQFDEALFNEDAKFVWQACLLAERICCSEEKLYYHVKRVGGNSLTGQPFDKRYFNVQTFCVEAERNMTELDGDYSVEKDVFLYNAYAHVIKTYIRDQKKGLIIDDYVEILTDFVNKIFQILFACKEYELFYDLENVLDIIDYMRREKLLNEKRLIKHELPCVGVLWNSVNKELVIETLEELKKNGIYIEKCYCVNMDNTLNDFIADVYFQNNDKDFVVPLKKQCLVDRYESNNINIVCFVQKVNKLVYLKRKKRFVFGENEQLRTEIRSFLKEKISSYVYDTAFHMTDCKAEYIYMKSICSKYDIEV